MAVTKIPASLTLSIEVSKGVDSSGNPIYSKKSFSNIKNSAPLENVFAVAQEISKVLASDTRNFFLNTSEMLAEK